MSDNVVQQVLLLRLAGSGNSCHVLHISYCMNKLYKKSNNNGVRQSTDT